MKCYIVAFLLLNILLGSCSSQKNQLVTLPNAVELYADSISIPPVLLAVTRMFIAHDTLIVYEQRKDTLFSFWKLPDCQYLFSAGTKGQGPDEFLMLDKVFVETDNGFKTFELSSNKVKNLMIDRKEGLKLSSEQRLEVEQMPLNRLLFLADSSYCFLSNDENYEYTLLDKKQKTHNFSQYPIEMIDKKADEINSFVYNKLTVAKPDGEKFAAFYGYIKMLRIHDRRGDLLKEHVMGKPVDLSDGDKRLTYYSSYPFASDKYIYVLNVVENQKKMEIWSWDGIPVAHFLLDKKIDSFTVSEKYNKVYAVDRDNENVIYTYNVSIE